ncbi:MAG TPA: hypothetical protein IGS40_12420 [Trichormus sp. M33_DOE_039]|nr:hypothetical protein [Trichormus sp. M33_DOE_039]
MTAVATSRETRRHLLQVGHCPPKAVSSQRSVSPTHCLPNALFPVKINE